MREGAGAADHRREMLNSFSQMAAHEHLVHSWHMVGSMLGHRQRRWPSIETTICYVCGEWSSSDLWLISDSPGTGGAMTGTPDRPATGGGG